VVLPYLTPIERLLVAVGQPRLPVWYYSFVASPATFLAGFGVPRIRFLTGTGEEGPPELPYGELPPEIPPSPEVKIKWDLMPREEATREFRLHEGNISDFLQNTLGTKIYVHKAEEYASVQIIGHPWLCLVFFVYPIDRKHLKGFEDCVREKLGIDGGTMGAKEIINILLSPGKFKRLKECYKSLTPNLNFTSLTLLVISTSRFSRKWCPIMMENSGIWWLIYPQSLSILSILLTGDVKLDVQKIWNSFRRRYEKMLQQASPGACIFQVPHHGGSKGFNPGMANVLNRPISIVSCSAHGIYNLPNSKVLAKLEDMSARVLLCNEYSPTRLSTWSVLKC
jgi:hypothetical protein